MAVYYKTVLHTASIRNTATCNKLHHSLLMVSHIAREGYSFHLTDRSMQTSFISDTHSMFHDQHSDLIHTCNTLGSHTERVLPTGLEFHGPDLRMYPQTPHRSRFIRTCVRHFSHSFGSCSPHTRVEFMVSYSSGCTNTFMFIYSAFNPSGVVIRCIH
jgi:hypothetical protein